MITYSLCSLHFPIQERYIPFFLFDPIIWFSVPLVEFY